MAHPIHKPRTQAPRPSLLILHAHLKMGDLPIGFADLQNPESACMLADDNRMTVCYVSIKLQMLAVIQESNETVQVNSTMCLCSMMLLYELSVMSMLTHAICVPLSSLAVITPMYVPCSESK